MPRPEPATRKSKLNGTDGKPGHRRRTTSARRVERHAGPFVFTELLRGRSRGTAPAITRATTSSVARARRWLAITSCGRGAGEALAVVGARATLRARSCVGTRSRPSDVALSSTKAQHRQLLADWVDLFAPGRASPLKRLAGGRPAPARPSALPSRRARTPAARGSPPAGSRRSKTGLSIASDVHVGVVGDESGIEGVPSSLRLVPRHLTSVRRRVDTDKTPGSQGPQTKPFHLRSRSGGVAI